MQFDSAGLKLTQHDFDPPLDRRVVRAVAGDKFLDNGPKRCERQLCVGDAHEVNILHDWKSTTTFERQDSLRDSTVEVNTVLVEEANQL